METVLAYILQVLFAMSSPPGDCSKLYHPKYDEYYFQSYIFCDCPAGYVTDGICFANNQSAYRKNLKDINTVYQLQMCICYQRWLETGNDEEFINCVATIVNTTDYAFQSAYGLFRYYCTVWCCVNEG